MAKVAKKETEVDVFDQATEREEKAREAAISEVRYQVHLLPYLGYCYYCDSPTPANHNFCDRFCRDDWDKEQKALRNQVRN